MNYHILILLNPEKIIQYLKITLNYVNFLTSPKKWLLTPHPIFGENISLNARAFPLPFYIAVSYTLQHIEHFLSELSNLQTDKQSKYQTLLQGYSSNSLD